MPRAAPNCGWPSCPVPARHTALEERSDDMEAYLGFARRAFQRAITYRFQFWTELVINILFMYIFVCMWRALYAGPRWRAMTARGC
jgi:hypothetical protein